MSKNSIVPVLSKTVPETLNRIAKGFFTGDRLVSSQSRNYSPHIEVIQQVIVKPVAKKKDYLPDILQLAKDGMSLKNIANLLGMSLSYVHKLFASAQK